MLNLPSLRVELGRRKEVIDEIAPRDERFPTVEAVGVAAAVKVGEVFVNLGREGIVVEGDAERALEEPLADGAEAGAARVLRAGGAGCRVGEATLGTGKGR